MTSCRGPWMRPRRWRAILATWSSAFTDGLWGVGRSHVALCRLPERGSWLRRHRMGLCLFAVCFPPGGYCRPYLGFSAWRLAWRHRFRGPAHKSTRKPQKGPPAIWRGMENTNFKTGIDSPTPLATPASVDRFLAEPSMPAGRIQPPLSLNIRERRCCWQGSWQKWQRS